MHKFLILFLLVLPCLASEPKFHYMDCVKVIQGFYKGCRGIVVNYIEPTYTVDISDCRDGGVVIQDFKEGELKGCRK